MAKKTKVKGDGLFKAFSNINWKKFLLTSVVVFIVIYLLDMLVHGYLMSAEYTKYARLFLSQKVMMARMWQMVTGQALFALFLVLLYSQGCSAKGSVTEGIRYGIYLGLLMQVPAIFMMYSTCFYPLSILYAWAGYGFLQTVIYGGVIGAMYKK